MRTSLEIVPHSTAELDAAIALIARALSADRHRQRTRSCELRAAQHRRGASHPRQDRASDSAFAFVRFRCNVVAPRHCSRRSSHAPSTRSSSSPATGRDGEWLRTDRADSLLAITRARLSVYAALDPHRYRDDAALARNIGAEARGGRMRILHATAVRSARLDRCSASLGDTTTFWGLSPVVSDRSQRYWQQVNRVRFPSEFVPTLNWNQSFALRFLSEIADRGGNAYLMPIKVDIERYLRRSQRALHSFEASSAIRRANRLRQRRQSATRRTRAFATDRPVPRL